MKFRFITYILLLISLTASAVTYPRLEFDRRTAASVGILIVDLKTNDTICQENIDQAFIPASIMKSLITAASLDKNGKDFVYRTRVELRGDEFNHYLNGDIKIYASGDPTIGSEFFSDRESLIDQIVEHVKERNIERIVGKIIVDESNFEDRGFNPYWEIDDRSHAYGAGFYGFNFSDNITRLNPATGTTSPEVPNVSVTKIRTKGKHRIEFGDDNKYTVFGKDLNKPDLTFKVPVANPADAFIQELTNALMKNGISVGGFDFGGKGRTNTIFVYESPSNYNILKSLMHRSDNMMAEATLRSLGLIGKNTRDNSIDKVFSFLKKLKVDLRDVDILDGSGLSRANHLTPRAISDVLTKMAANKIATDYISLFPRVGIEGTVNTFLQNSFLEGRLVLKSGSLKGVQCFAGYLLDDDGNPTHSVVMMVNNFTCTRTSLRRSMAEFFENVFSFVNPLYKTVEINSEDAKPVEINSEDAKPVDTKRPVTKSKSTKKKKSGTVYHRNYRNR